MFIRLYSDRLLAVSSSGGHWIQLMKLSPIFENYQTSYVCTDKSVSVNAHGCLHAVKDANLTNKFGLVILAFQVMKVVFRERPAIIISTGAAPGFFALFFGKIIGAKTVWVDSIANVDKVSKSGEMVKRLADIWLTQWPHLEANGGPFYRGSVI